MIYFLNWFCHNIDQNNTLFVECEKLWSEQGVGLSTSVLTSFFFILFFYIYVAISVLLARGGRLTIYHVFNRPGVAGAVLQTLSSFLII